MYNLLINLLSLQSIPLIFRICINLVQFTRSNAFCQSMKQIHSQLSLQFTKIIHKARKETQAQRNNLDCWRNVDTSSDILTAWKHLMLQATIKRTEIFKQSLRPIFSILTKVGFFLQIFSYEYLISNFAENRQLKDAHLHLDRRTD